MIKGLVLWAVATIVVWFFVNGLNGWLFTHTDIRLSYCSVPCAAFIAFLLWIARRMWGGKGRK